MVSKLSLLKNLFERVEANKKAVLLVGKYGIGKSSIVYQYAQKRSKDLNRELAIWHELTEEEKKKVIENPENYYVLVDIKGSMISPENLIMPKFTNGDVEWSVPLWVKVFEKEESAGILFIDEINMTPPSLQSILFELILQRKIAETSLKSKNLLVVGAGNDLESNEYANEIPKPLLNRFLVINFDEIITYDDFVRYAMNKDFDKRVIYYILFKKSVFTKANESLKQSTTPRSLEMLSDMIKDANDLEYIELVAKSLLEEHDAIEFIAFVENIEKLKDIDEYVKDITKIHKLEEDQKFIVIMKIVDYYLESKIDARKLADILTYLKEKDLAEYVLVALKRIKENKEKFDELVDVITREDEYSSLINLAIELNKYYE